MARRALLAWELGDGLGHAQRLAVVAAELVRRGWQVAVVAGNETPISFPGCRVGRLKRPVPDSVPHLRSTETLADLLVTRGYTNSAWLRSAVRAWDAAFESVRPDVIVGDFAPSLRLAAAGRLPFVAVSNGFATPPPGSRLSPLRYWEGDVDEEARRREATLMNTVASIRPSEIASIDGTPALFRGDATFACTVALFDPYRTRRGEATWWPPTLREPSPSRNQNGPSADILVYLPSSHPALESVHQALAECRRSALVFAGGTQAPAQLPPTITWSTAPLPLAAVLQRARLIIHHGGLGTAQTAVLAGVPQFCLPVALEHHITSRILVEAEAGEFLSAAAPPSTAKVGDALGQVLANPHLEWKAKQAAERIERGSADETLSAIIAACSRLGGAA